MTQPPEIADRTALARNRARARRHTRAGAPPFLHVEACAEIKERLSEVNRRFTRPAVITALPEFWADLLPGALVVSAADLLPLAPGAHDLVIHAMALHWVRDPVGQLVQARRALVPDGLFLGVLPGGQTLSELRAALAQAEVELCGGLSPRVLPMAEIRDLGGLLQRAGLALPVADSVTLRASYRDLRHLAADLRAMGEGNALSARARRGAPRALFERAETIYRTHFPAPDERIRASFELIFLTGWAPGPGQPRARPPGSATQRLAEALGTTETALAATDNAADSAPPAPLRPARRKD